MDLVLALAAGATIGALVVWLSVRARRPHQSERPLGDRSSVRRRPAPAAADVLDALDEGVVVFDDALTLILVNRAARSILRIPTKSLPPRLANDELLSLARRSLAGAEETTGVVHIGGDRPLTVTARAAPRPDGEGVVVTLRDTSREELVQRMRRQFVSHASHELKTPVASIRTLSEAIETAAQKDAPAAGRMAMRLTQEAERLGDLIHDLLELARLEEPAAVTTRKVNLSELAAEQVGQMGPMLGDRSLTVERQIDTDLFVRGDEKQLALLMRNLLDNAIRYSDEGGTIVVNLTRTEGDVQVNVIDEGIGIPLRDQSRIFERFYRVDEARARDSGGTGLGLAIVKHVADLHGGRVSVMSAVGEGSTFTVTFPAVAPQ